MNSPQPIPITRVAESQAASGAANAQPNARDLTDPENWPKSFRHVHRDGRRIFVDGSPIGELEFNPDAQLRPESPAVPNGLPCLVAEMPKALRKLLDEDRDAVLIKLIFAARRLADAQLRSFGDGEGQGCLVCLATAGPRVPLRHAASCGVGEVLGKLAELQHIVVLEREGGTL